MTKQLSEAELDDQQFDMEPCICDHFRKQHHYRTDHCTYPGCGCTKFDAVYGQQNDVVLYALQCFEAAIVMAEMREIPAEVTVQRWRGAFTAALAQQRKRHEKAG